MNPPRKHHYIPAFYLKQWAGVDERVCVMRKVPRGLSVLRPSPNATGFKLDLYKIENVPAHEAQQFESVFLSLADNDAYYALEKLISDNRNWTSRYRSAWARFIISLLFRNPENVADIRDHILNLWEAGKDVLREVFKTHSETGETFDQYFTRVHGGRPNVDAAQFLRMLIDNERVGQTLVGMQWDVIELKNTRNLLMTSDRPMDWPLGLGNPGAHIAIPIGPRRLFIAAFNRDFAAQINRQSHESIVTQINTTVVTQAREYVWAFSDASVRFVQRRICTTADRIMLSEEQKKNSLDAVRSAPPLPAPLPITGP